MKARTFAEQQWAFKLLDATVNAVKWEDAVKRLREAMLEDKRDEVSRRAWEKALAESALADEELERIVEVVRLSMLENKELAS